MRILIIAHFAGSPHHGMVYGHYYLAREWVRMGHQVTIVAAAFAHTRHRQPECRRWTCEERIDGVRYLWLRVPVYSQAGRLGRVLNILAFTARVHLLRMGPYDAVVLSCHHPLPILAASRMAKRWNAVLIFEVRDLWPLTLIELGGASPQQPFIRLMQCAEDMAYRRSDCVVSLLSNARDYMAAHGMEPRKFVFVPNGVEVEPKSAPVELPAPQKTLLDRLRRSGAFLVGYAGRIGLANALHSLVQAMCLLQEPEVHLVVLGDGAFREELLEIAAGCGVAERLHLLEPVDKAQVAAFLERMDLLYVGLQHQALFRYGVSPTKLNDYMLAGRPILYAIDAPPDVIGESASGLSVAAEDASAIAGAIKRFQQMPRKEREAMGRRARKWVVANRDYRVLARRFLTAIEDVRER